MPVADVQKALPKLIKKLERGVLSENVQQAINSAVKVKYREPKAIELNIKPLKEKKMQSMEMETL